MGGQYGKISKQTKMTEEHMKCARDGALAGIFPYLGKAIDCRHLH
jgi:hypothetical protein